MCGIAGIVSVDGLDSGAKALLGKMCDVMVHRGPEDAGFHFSARADLGMRRLSILLTYRRTNGPHSTLRSS